MTHENVFECDSCLNLQAGYSEMDNVMQPVIAARKMTSLETRQAMGIRKEG
jgi:hypothetical protein